MKFALDCDSFRKIQLIAEWVATLRSPQAATVAPWQSCQFFPQKCRLEFGVKEGFMLCGANAIRLVAFGILLFSSGCVIFGGNTAEDRVSSLRRSKNYQVEGHPNWKSIDRADSDIAFRLQSANVATVTSSCERDAAQPLELLTKHLLIGARKIQIVKRETMIVNESPGLYSHVRAQLENRPFELHLFVISKGNCVFDFSLVSPSKISDEEVNEFLSFVRSFRYAAD